MIQKVLVAMSGGVDSSVAAYLLKKQGYSVVGVTMCLGVEGAAADSISCCGPQAIHDARLVCQKLSIPHHVLDFSAELDKYVIKNFIEEYSRGRTPNPCIRCNEYLKFNVLLKKAQAMGFQYLATGHYARIVFQNEKGFLKRPKDRDKDQTYFLYGIKRQDLSSILFPLSDLKKSEVRKLAKKAHLPVAEKVESQDICFINDGNYRTMLEKMKPKGKGLIMALDGTVLGSHTGIENYTIGQRRGLGIAAGKPLYVVAIDREQNRIIVGSKKDMEVNGLMASALNLLVDKLPEQDIYAQIRYSHTPAECRARISNHYLLVRFKLPQQAVTPGQSVVLYDNDTDTVLGGAIIAGILDEDS